MKNFLKKAAFPVLLVLACVTLHFWQHAAASLPYMPMNGLVPLATLSPALFALTFLTTFVLLRQSDTPKPVLRSLLSTAAMLAVVLILGVIYVGFLSRRFAAILPPIPALPDWPTGIATLITTVLLVLHLTGLLIFRFVKQKTPAKRAASAAAGWLVLNLCLFLITI